MKASTAYLLEGPSDPKVLLKHPGIYVAHSSSPSYGVLKGLGLTGGANVLGETYLEDGQLSVAVEIGGYRRNDRVGQIRLGDAAYAKVLLDYSDWREKWWREAIQNSVDAGATEIECVITALDEAGRPTDHMDHIRSVEVSCQDNGKGMDEDTIADKFLTGGETTKEGEGGIGGFGKAKELLLFPWLKWHLHSRSSLVTGVRSDWQMKTLPHSRQGTGLTVWMAADKHTTAADVQSFLKKSWIPGVKFTVNGQSVSANQKVGHLVEENEIFKITYKKTSKDFSEPTCLVRVHGMFMFDQWITSEAKGVVIVEITAPSITVLQSNRDRFREYKAERALQEYLGRLSADVKSATKGAKNIVKKKFHGTGKFEVKPEEVEATMLASMGSTEPRDRGAKEAKTLTDGQLEVLLTVVDDFAGRIEDGDAEGVGAGLNLRAQRSSAEAMLDVPVTGPAHVEAIARQLAWEPDFYVYNEVEDFHVPAKLMPEKMTPQVQKLARFWAEMCRFVLIQLGSSQRYGIGWHFDEYEDNGGMTAASYLNDGGEHWLMLNPFVRGNVKDGDIYSLSDKKHVNQLYALAVHECTHMSDGVSRHNEAFTTAFTFNVARTANRGKQIEQIRKAVVARGSKVGKLGDLETPRRPVEKRGYADQPSARRLLDAYQNMESPPIRAKMDAETAAGYALDFSLGTDSDIHPHAAIRYAKRQVEEFTNWYGRAMNAEEHRNYANGMKSWAKAVEILESLPAEL